MTTPTSKPMSEKRFAELDAWCVDDDTGVVVWTRFEMREALNEIKRLRAEKESADLGRNSALQHLEAHEESLKAELAHLRKQRDDLQAANTAEVERRRKAEAEIGRLKTHLIERHHCDMESEDPDYGF